jgi:DEAD/DEAH box helicase domain-containing protein
VDEEALLVHGYGAGRAEDVYDEDKGKKDRKEVLLFEFVDGDLKGNKMTSGREEMRMPTFSTAQMTKLISKRNEKFSDAVNAFLDECAMGGFDAVEGIKSRYHLHLPRGAQALSLPASTPFEIPKERISISQIIQEIKDMDYYQDQIVPNGHRVFPAQEAMYGQLTFQLSQALVDALYTAHNITQLYSHQAEAINNLHDGNHVIVSTSTSSGKSLIYQIPVLHELEKDRNARAMFIFPTKALAQDQRRSLMEVLGYMTEVLGSGLRVDTFDGDTPMEERGKIRDEASVVFTNPDMLHLTILPNEGRWRGFLRSLKYVVVDGWFPSFLSVRKGES